MRTYLREKPWMQATVISLLVLCMLLLLFYPKYENDADIVMQVMLTDGLKTGDSFAHILFSNYLLGLVLSFLYGLFAKVQWYYFCLLGLSFFSITIIDTIILKRNFNNTGRIIIFIISVFLGCECYLLPVYLKTSAILCIASMFLLVTNILDHHYNLSKNVISIILVVFSILLSTKIFIFTFAGTLVATIIFFSQKKVRLEGKKQLFIIGAFVLLFLIALESLDYVAYNNSYWDAMAEYRKSFEQLYSFGMPDYYDVKDLLPDDMLEYNYSLVKHGDFMYGDKATFDLFKEITQQRPEISLKSFFYFTRNNLIKLISIGISYLWVLIAYCIVAFKKGNHKIFLVSSVLMGILGIAVFYFMEALDYKWMYAIALMPMLFYVFLNIEKIECEDNRIFVAYIMVLSVILYNKFASDLRTSIPKYDATEYIENAETYGYLDYNKFLKTVSVTSNYPNSISRESIQITNAIYSLVPTFYDSTHTKRAIENDVWISNPSGIRVSDIWKGDNYDRIIIIPSDWTPFGDVDNRGKEVELCQDTLLFGPYFPITKGKYIITFVGDSFADANVDVWSNGNLISFLDKIPIEEKLGIIVNIDRDVDDLEVRIFHDEKKHALINYCILKRCE